MPANKLDFSTSGHPQGGPLQAVRVAFVSNFAVQYRGKMLDALALLCDLRYYPCSGGGRIQELLFGNHDLFIQAIHDRFALLVTFLVAKIRRKPFLLWTGVWRRRPLIRFFYRHSDAIVADGEHVKRYLITEGVDPGRIFL